MDLETLGPLALILLYLLFQLFTRRKQPEKRPPLPRPEQAREDAQEPATLQEALSEIRRAMGMEEPEPYHAPPRPPAPVRAPEWRRPVPATPTRTRERGAPRKEKSLSPRRSTPVLDDSPEAGADAHVRRQALLERLSTPDSAREAVLLADILGPPKSRRRLGHRT
jgi:hypothetical protein